MTSTQANGVFLFSDGVSFGQKPLVASLAVRAADAIRIHRYPQNRQANRNEDTTELVGAGGSSDQMTVIGDQVSSVSCRITQDRNQ